MRASTLQDAVAHLGDRKLLLRRPGLMQEIAQTLDAATERARRWSSLPAQDREDMRRLAYAILEACDEPPTWYGRALERVSDVFLWIGHVLRRYNRQDMQLANAAGLRFVDTVLEAIENESPALTHDLGERLERVRAERAPLLAGAGSKLHI